jgi:lactate permease
MWQHNYEPVAGSLGVSALVAAIPIFVLFYMLGIRRTASWQAALAALASAGRDLARRLRHAGAARVHSPLYGAAFGLFPIAWVVFSSICCIASSVDTGKFEIIKDSVGGLTQDRRLQAMFIAFSFGAVHRRRRGLRRAGRRVGRDARRPRVQSVLRRRHLSCSPTPRRSPSARSAFRSSRSPTSPGLPVMPLSAMVGRLCAIVSIFIPATCWW